MKFDAVKQRLAPFGDVAVSRNDGQVVFTVETTLDGADTVEELGVVTGDIPTASVAVAGNNRGDALIIVEVDYEEIDLVPPYLDEDM